MVRNCQYVIANWFVVALTLRENFVYSAKSFDSEGRRKEAEGRRDSRLKASKHEIRT